MSRKPSTPPAPTPDAPTIDEGTGRPIISISPYEMSELPGTALLADIAAFPNTPDLDKNGKPLWAEPHLVWPLYLRETCSVACELTARVTEDHKPIPRVRLYGYSLKHAQRLGRWSGVEVIDDARTSLRRNGDIARLLQLEWSFQLTGLQGERKTKDVYPRIAESTWRAVCSLGEAIGVTPNTIAALAHMAILVKLPVADHVRRHMLGQLALFKECVGHLAVEAAALKGRSKLATTDLPEDFGNDVLAAEKGGDR
jgi:hypothetical protein